MAEYINRNELVENLDRFAAEHFTPLIRTLIEKQPTADVVEVVRCKDCKHGHWNQETCHGKPVFYCDRTDLQVSKYSFCSYGERK